MMKQRARETSNRPQWEKKPKTSMKLPNRDSLTEPCETYRLYMAAKTIMQRMKTAICRTMSRIMAQRYD